MLPAIRLYRQGYPDYMPLGEFVRRFNVLVPPDALPASLLTGLNSSTASEKQAAEILLLHIDMERSSYRLGLSQVRESPVVAVRFSVFLFPFFVCDRGSWAIVRISDKGSIKMGWPSVRVQVVCYCFGVNGIPASIAIGSSSSIAFVIVRSHPIWPDN